MKLKDYNRYYDSLLCNKRKLNKVKTRLRRMRENCFKRSRVTGKYYGSYYKRVVNKIVRDQDIVIANIPLFADGHPSLKINPGPW